MTERPHVFFGQVIGVDDLEQEQLYHRPHPQSAAIHRAEQRSERRAEASARFEA